MGERVRGTRAPGWGWDEVVDIFHSTRRVSQQEGEKDRR
jgi:hypothetical protein